jgi:predicted acyltransferase
MALFLWVIDVKGWKAWAQPFVWVGLNPLTVYLVANVVSFDNLARRVAGGELATGLNGMLPHLGDLLLAVVGIAWGFLLAWFLHRRKLYLRI